MQQTIHILWVDRYDAKSKSSFLNYLNYSSNNETLISKANLHFDIWTSRRRIWKPESPMRIHHCSQDEWIQTKLDNPDDFTNIQREDFIIETHTGTNEHINEILAKHQIM